MNDIFTADIIKNINGKILELNDFFEQMLDFYVLDKSEISFDVIANKEFNIK